MSGNVEGRRDVQRVVEEVAGDAPPLPRIREDEAAVEAALNDDLLPIPDLEMIPEDEIDNRFLNGYPNPDDNPDDENDDDNNDDDDDDDEEDQLNRNQFPQELLQELRVGALDLLLYVPRPEQQQQLINGNARREGRPFLIRHRRPAIDQDEPDNGNDDNNRN